MDQNAPTAAGSRLSRRRVLVGGAAAALLGGALAAPMVRGMTGSDEDPAADGFGKVTTVPVAFDSDDARLRGNLFVPEGQPVAAVVFSGPMTSVKEQSAGVYAQALAGRGFVALAFDHRHFGASDGDPRQLEDPEAKIADIRNAVTALGGFDPSRTLPIVGLGLCIGGGYMARAVADDSRIAAFAGIVGAYVTPTKLSSVMGPGYSQRMDRARAADAQWKSTGVAETIPAVGPNGGDVGMPAREAYDYYGTSRAGASYVNRFAVQSWAHSLPFDTQAAAARIRVPTVVVHSETATFPDLARQFYANLGVTKQQVWLRSQGQVDFYDDPVLIRASVDAATAHFHAALSRS